MIINIFIVVLFNLWISHSEAYDFRDTSMEPSLKTLRSSFPNTSISSKTKNKIKQSSAVLSEGSERSNKGLRRLTNPPNGKYYVSVEQDLVGIRVLKIHSGEPYKQIKIKSNEEGDIYPVGAAPRRMLSRKANPYESSFNSSSNSNSNSNSGFLLPISEEDNAKQHFGRSASIHAHVFMGGNIISRAVVEADLVHLNRLMLESKKTAGGDNYSTEYLDEFMRKLSFTPEILKVSKAEVLLKDTTIVGFYSLYLNEDGELELDNFFVGPQYLYKGYGKMLWDLCLAMARTYGKHSFILWSSKEAEEFYKKRGCVKIGEKPSPADTKRIQPLLKYVLGSSSGSPTSMSVARNSSYHGTYLT